MNPAFIILPLLLLFPFVLLLDFKGRFRKGMPYVLLAYLFIAGGFFFFRVVPMWSLPVVILVALAVFFAVSKKVKDPN